MNEFLTNMFGDLTELPWWGWLLLAALLAGGCAAFLTQKKNRKSFWNAQTMAVGAMCIALASVLSCIKLWAMPFGGSVTLLSMLPMLLFAYCYGTMPGLVLGALYGVLQFLLDGARFAALGAIPNLLDYPIAFGLLGLAGLFGKASNQKLGLTLGFLLGVAGRCFASFLSGVIFYAEYAPEGMNPAVYSIAYNGAYLLPECILCIGVGLLIAPRLVKELRKVK